MDIIETESFYLYCKNIISNVTPQGYKRFKTSYTFNQWNGDNKIIAQNVKNKLKSENINMLILEYEYNEVTFTLEWN